MQQFKNETSNATVLDLHCLMKVPRAASLINLQHLDSGSFICFKVYPMNTTRFYCFKQRCHTLPAIQSHCLLVIFDKQTNHGGPSPAGLDVNQAWRWRLCGVCVCVCDLLGERWQVPHHLLLCYLWGGRSPPLGLCEEEAGACGPDGFINHGKAQSPYTGLTAYTVLTYACVSADCTQLVRRIIQNLHCSWIAEMSSLKSCAFVLLSSDLKLF